MATIETLIAGYGACQWTADSNTKGVSHDESLIVPSNGGNCMNWVAGHILATRANILGILGGNGFLRKEEAAFYGRGSAAITAGSPCVPFERLREGLAATNAIFNQLMMATSESALAEKFEMKEFPIQVQNPSRESFLILFLFHESYHAGQLGILRRMLGKESVIK